MISTFLVPEKVITGAGCLKGLGAECEPLGQRAVLVTGKSAMQRAGHTQTCTDILGEHGIAVEVFAGMEPEPDVATIDACGEAIGKFGADFVIGLGGGSALDGAKVAAGLARQDAPTAAFHAGEKVLGNGLPFVAIPTTSGTGSEVTNTGVISDREKRIKKSIRHANFIARVAMVDALLTLSVPPRITATTGIDAMVQAIESYLSIHAYPLTETLSIGAMVELAAALPRVVEHPDDIASRERASYGSLMAGIALQNARLGIVHGIAHPLGIRYGIPHGLACGILLPGALEFNRTAAAEKMRMIEHVVGAEPVGYARDLLASCGLPQDFKEFDIPPADFEQIAAESLPSGSLKANPRPVRAEDVIFILQELC
ncbi:MAG: iron-containing alcohol dehydrogenase [Phycisphaerae bacterium]|jgi:alcohol dehydrogenase class IV|nr:iron-containing alcohol dehydrogenase [Phycisphaerae bacterium]